MQLLLQIVDACGMACTRRICRLELTIIPCVSMPLAESVMCIIELSVSVDMFQDILNLHRNAYEYERGGEVRATNLFWLGHRSAHLAAWTDSMFDIYPM